MQKTIYEDYKYCMQDVGNIYIGSKYTFAEILEEENIHFKFRLIMERYMLPELDLQDTLETHLYYLSEQNFQVKIYKQLKAKVKVNIIEEKRTLTGRKKQYVTRLFTVEQLAKMPISKKEEKGVVIQELQLSKLALMSF